MAQGSKDEKGSGKFSYVSGTTIVSYQIGSVNFNNWCTHRSFEVAVPENGSPINPSVNNFSFGTRPGEGVESVRYVRTENNQRIYEVIGAPRAGFNGAVYHNAKGNFTGTSDTFMLPIGNVIDAVPQVNIVNSNTVEIPSNQLLDVAEYRWFRNGVLYTTTNSAQFNISEVGTYTVQMVLSSGCLTLVSGSFTFVTDISGRIVKECQVFPSPASNAITIAGIDWREGDKLVITSLVGEEVLKTTNFHSGISQLNIDITGIKSGLYFVSVYRNNVPYAYKRFLKK
ncbi:MAG: T9SS C-terminal target domain-containing protein [Chitinophagia bacterium]|nr:T9SS C-terminal target domain-containing protein [Chitinophagia bacterium]